MVAVAVAWYGGTGSGKVHAQDSVGTVVGYNSPANETLTIVEGSGSTSDKASNTTVEGYSITAADFTGEPWDFSVGGNNEGDHIYIWMMIYEAWDTLANGGFRIRIADDLATDSVGTWYVGPQPGFLGGWYSFCVNPAADFDAVVAGTGSWTTTGNPAQLTGIDGFGVGWKTTSIIQGNIDNTFVDAMVVGKGYALEGGDGASADGVFQDFIDMEDNTTSGRYGGLRGSSGILFARCKLALGDASGSVSTVFTDSNFVVVWEPVFLSDGSSSGVASDHYELVFQQDTGTTTVTMTDGAFFAISPHTVTFSLAGITSATLTRVNLDRGATVTLDSAVSWTDSTISNTDEITVAGATFTGNTILSPTVAADGAALLWDVAGDPDGELDNTSIAKGTNAHHAIEFGTTAPLSITLRGMAFTGFNASNAQNDSTFNVLRTTGTVTINVVGCTGNFSYKTAGATVVIVEDPVTTSVHVQDINTGSALSGARVFAKVTSSAGGWPFNAAITSITRSAAVATVTTTAPHGLTTNDWVQIQGANETDYNRLEQITVTGASTFTYAITGTPSSPATGTITYTFAPIAGTTDGSGDISSTYAFAANQPITGFVALATTPGSLYKRALLSGTISSTAGLSVTVNMIPDE